MREKNLESRRAGFRSCYSIYYRGGNWMAIDYDSDLVKHFVRTDGWLPLCRRRLEAISQEQPRRLRYFTFCAVGAVDVLMLDVAKVVKLSSTSKFDTVAFFGRDDESIVETVKRIPGAVGFPGNFVDVVLCSIQWKT